MELEDDMAPEMEYPKIFVERTLAIVKPDAVVKTEEIQDIILRSGFAILEVTVDSELDALIVKLF